jgi:hypothetical protein
VNRAPGGGCSTYLEPPLLLLGGLGRAVNVVRGQFANIPAIDARCAVLWPVKSHEVVECNQHVVVAGGHDDVHVLQHEGGARVEKGAVALDDLPVHGGRDAAGAVGQHATGIHGGEVDLPQEADKDGHALFHARTRLPLDPRRRVLVHDRVRVALVNVPVGDHLEPGARPVEQVVKVKFGFGVGDVLGRNSPIAA